MGEGKKNVKFFETSNSDKEIEKYVEIINEMLEIIVEKRLKQLKDKLKEREKEVPNQDCQCICGLI